MYSRMSVVLWLSGFLVCALFEGKVGDQAL